MRIEPSGSPRQGTCYRSIIGAVKTEDIAKLKKILAANNRLTQGTIDRTVKEFF